MKRNILITILAMLFLVVSCNDDDGMRFSDDDYLIFGLAYGMCDENCVTTLKLEPNKLFIDTSGLVPGGVNYEPIFVEMSEEDFNYVKDLIDYFPHQLLDETEGIIGQLNAGDAGVIYIEYKSDGEIKDWYIDSFKERIPEYYHEFIDKVNEKAHHYWDY